MSPAGVSAKFAAYIFERQDLYKFDKFESGFFFDMLHLFGVDWRLANDYLIIIGYTSTFDGISLWQWLDVSFG